MAGRDDAAGRAIKIWQFTDTHILAGPEARFLGVDSFASLNEVIDLALAGGGIPDLVLLTGDLSQDESADSYRRLAGAVSRVAAPVYALPGNHDRPELLMEMLSALGGRFSCQREVVCGSWLVVLLDTSVSGRVEGWLGDGELSRLDGCLAEHPEKHALVCLHHNPVPVGSEWVDRLGLTNADQFLTVIDRHPNVRGLLWGHVHQEFAGRRGRAELLGTPSTCVQFKPQASRFQIDGQAPGYRWLELNPDGGIRSAVSRLDHLPDGLTLDCPGY